MIEDSNTHKVANKAKKAPVHHSHFRGLLVNRYHGGFELLREHDHEYLEILYVMSSDG